MIASMTEEAEAINWYEQRISLEPDAQAKAIMQNAQLEEFKHFGMDLEFLLRRRLSARELKRILFTEATSSKAGVQADARRRSASSSTRGGGESTRAPSWSWSPARRFQVDPCSARMAPRLGGDLEGLRRHGHSSETPLEDHSEFVGISSQSSATTSAHKPAGANLRLSGQGPPE
jgi:hypothetical protein